MKKTILLFILCFSLNSFSQDETSKEYSYSEFFELIKKEKDTIFILKDAIVKYDSIQDKEFLAPDYSISRNANKAYDKERHIVNKAIVLENVQFIVYQDYKADVMSSIHSIVFEKDVTILNSFEFAFSNCIFKKAFKHSNFKYPKFEVFKEKYPAATGSTYIYQSQFLGSCRIINSSTNLEDKNDFGWQFVNNTFGEKCSRIYIGNFLLNFVDFSYNTFNTSYPHYIHIEQLTQAVIENNTFNNGLPQFYCIEIDELIFKDNAFNVPSLINFKATNNVNFIGVNQFKSTTSSLDGFDDYKRSLNQWINFTDISNFDLFNNYNTKEKIQNPTTYQYELDQKSVFYNYFKEKHNTVEANKFYVEIKELESQRIAYEHNLNPTFNTFFKLQINKFLKLFSNYGTEPEGAVVVSIYVILLFALIYLFFPNSWDKHGKNRIMDRYRFFTKYMSKDAGMHDVYLEEQQDELLASEDFKTYMLKAEKHIPKFFIATALPLYRWSVSGTKLSASFLKRVDIMKGTWNELPKSKRVWKSILLVGAFLIAIVYDIFIKILNALMLSINTFTTLGFGEIPIKGLPRYLAIIQGFIGWFMLTIFSVSLISQLLN
ncbi:potassium channel family protein [Winogradskyella jejuensis]|uniref:Ion channel n=1 Tax=Winogradskyella jejuensis TaxID=1089305 RepID=A0A1M5SU94_9FLAO|nr:potassium channel family protein [Winogradskyella jejuensis]SHH42111.1 Ion channel [Winogradskyella jejuensis]